MQITDFKILVVGCGSIGKRHTECLDKIGIKNMVFFDVDENIAREMAEKYNGSYVKSFEEGVDLVDVVYVLSPTKLHVEQATYAVNHKKHVFVEKPLSITLDGTAELDELAKKNNVLVGTAFCLRFHEGVQKMKKMVDDGEIGSTVCIRAMVGEHFPSVRPDYMSTYYVKYSGTFELVHDLDLAIYFGGKDLVDYSGFYGSYANMGFESPDTAEIILKFEDCVANVHLDFFQRPRVRTLTVHGEKGQIVLEFSSWDKYTISKYLAETDSWTHETFPAARNDMFVAESENFLNAILGKEEVKVPISEAVKSLKVINAIYKEQ